MLPYFRMLIFSNNNEARALPKVHHVAVFLMVFDVTRCHLNVLLFVQKQLFALCESAKWNF